MGITSWAKNRLIMLAQALPGEDIPMPEEPELAKGQTYNVSSGPTAGSTDAVEISNPDAYASYYPSMYEGDETVGTGVEFLSLNVMSKIGEYQHEDPKIQEYIERAISRLKGSWKTRQKEMLVYLFSQGYTGSEFSLANENGEWLPTGLWVYPPDTLKLKLGMNEDNSQGVVTIKQNVSGREVDIPRNKMLLFSSGDTSSPYGKSRLRRGYRWWDMKREALRLWAVSMEKFGMPTIDCVGDAQDEDLKSAISGLHSQGYIIHDEETRISLLERGGIGSAEYVDVISLCNKLLYRSLFLGSLLEGGETGGSYSLGSVHYRMFDDACAEYAAEIGEDLLEQFFRPLIFWNFGPQESYGKLPVTDRLSADDQERVVSMFDSAVNMGVLFPEDDGDLNWMREKIGLPKYEGGEGDSWRVNGIRSRFDRKTATGGGSQETEDES